MTKNEIAAFSKDELLKRDNILQIFAEESEIEKFYLLEAVKERAKELKCAKAVNALVSATKKDVTKEEKELRRGPGNNKTEFGHPTGELNCGNWIADFTGIRILTVFGDRLACYHPILPVERLFNLETRTEKITLAYQRDHQWKEITVDKGLIASASKIVRLADYGISVTSESAKALVQYLSDVENLNDIPLKNSTSKFGWHGNEFIPIDNNVIFDDESRFKELADSLKASGSFDIWKDLCLKVRANKQHYEPQIYMSASFASVLVSKLNMLPFIVNLWGGTGKGKTVALMMAASIWANPAENRYITDSYATQNAFEIRLDILNHLPLLMDDLSKVKDKLNDNFTDLIYLLCSGKGKDRSNVDLGLNKVKTWQNTILSNMERPLATDTMKGGAINRILDFEMMDGYIFQNGNGVVEILKDNYGFAGAMFVDLIKDLDIQFLNNLRKEYEQKIKEEAKRQKSEKEEKQILPMSLLLAADKIATDYIFEDGIYLDLPTMVSQLKDINEVSEGRRAYETIMDYMNVYQGKFTDDPAKFTPECWGYVKDDYLHIIPAAMKKIAATENFSVKAFCSWAKAKGVLKTNNDRNQLVVFAGGASKRYYCVKLELVEDIPVDEWNNAESENELPFD